MLKRSPIPRRSIKGKRTSKRRKARKASAKKCDAAFSKIVRSVGVCEGPSTASGAYVMCAGPLQCAHIVSRRYRAVRWHRDNALCLCAAHHTYWTFRPIEFERFVTEKIGAEAYSALKTAALRFVKPDYDAILQGLMGA